MSQTLYDTIQDAWNTARSNQKDPFEETSEVEHARKLEQLLADRFEPHLEQYNQGLISASELLALLYTKAYTAIEEGEF